MVRVGMKTTGALTINSATWMLKAARTKVEVEGALTLGSGTVTFRCGAAVITATAGKVTMEAPDIKITGSYTQSKGMIHS
jgi:phage baseplate assembly protein gpV